MRRSIYIQFVFVILALGVLFYVALFNEGTYVEIPTNIGIQTENDLSSVDAEMPEEDGESPGAEAGDDSRPEGTRPDGLLDEAEISANTSEETSFQAVPPGEEVPPSDQDETLYR